MFYMATFITIHIKSSSRNPIYIHLKIKNCITCCKITQLISNSKVYPQKFTHYAFICPKKMVRHLIFYFVTISYRLL